MVPQALCPRASLAPQDPLAEVSLAERNKHTSVVAIVRTVAFVMSDKCNWNSSHFVYALKNNCACCIFLKQEVQGDMPACSLGFVDIKIEVAF